MAFRKKIATAYGVFADYWRIEDIQSISDQIKIRFQLFMSDDNGDRMGKSISVKDTEGTAQYRIFWMVPYTFMKFVVDNKITDWKEALYLILKRDENFFADAENILEDGQLPNFDSILS